MIRELFADCIKDVLKLLLSQELVSRSMKSSNLRDSSGHAGYSLRPKVLGWYGLAKVQERRCLEQRAFCSCGEGVQTTREPNGG